MASPTRGTRQYEEITFVTSGPVARSAIDQATTMVERITAKSPRPVIFARVKLIVDPERPIHQQAVAQATLDVSGVMIRAESQAGNLDQALDLLADRLERRVRRLADRREDADSRPPSTPPGEWRRGDLPESRPAIFPRPTGEREVVRHKTYAPEKVAIEEALFDLDVFDHRFFLFTDAEDEEDSIVYEEDDGVKLRRVDGSRPRMADPLDLDVEETPAPALTVQEAVDDLNLSDQPFVFFRNAETDRAAALYRRFDGHYGLVEPAR